MKGSKNVSSLQELFLSKNQRGSQIHRTMGNLHVDEPPIISGPLLPSTSAEPVSTKNRKSLNPNADNFEQLRKDIGKLLAGGKVKTPELNLEEEEKAQTIVSAKAGI